MGEWWSNIAAFERIFWYFAVPSTVIFLIQLIMTFAGMGDDYGDADSIDDLDDPGGDDGFSTAFRLFTVRNLITFFTVFGWSGIMLINAGKSNAFVIIASTILGIIVMLVVASLFFFITRLAESGNVDLINTKGLTGKAYLPIPSNKSGIGKVHINIQGALREVDVMTEGDAISTGELVEVIDVLDNILIVEKK